MGLTIREICDAGDYGRGEAVANYHYTVYFQPLPEGGYQAVFPSIPEIVTYGASLEEARRMAAEALRCHLEGLLKDGEKIPVESTLLGEPIKETLDISL
jgi:predicted RNase H-like HicB family nuclease